MCGIAGIITENLTDGWSQIGEAMLRSLSHRGPDDNGWLAFGNESLRRGQDVPDNLPLQTLLMHRRLSILDLSESGRQPMSTSDDRLHITFNGEIYNYREIRTELLKLGHTFRSNTDTEVLLYAWKEWQVGCLKRLIGMFSFAVLDTLQRTVTLVRDFFGIKPLFYTHTKNHFAFASEIKGLFPLPGFSRKANANSLHSFLWHGVDDHCPSTMFEHVQQLPAAHYIQLSIDDLANASPTRYWSLDSKRRSELSFNEAATRLRELFLDSIQLHLRSDVPIGTALSGGIDSSSIVGAIRHLLGPNGSVHTFSYVAKDSPYDEERWVDKVAVSSATKVHKVQITSRELIRDLDTIVASQDEPFSTSSICAQFRVFQLAHEAGIKVLLDGQGADEMLGGYPSFVRARLVSLLSSCRVLKAAAFSKNASHLLGSRPLRLLLSEASHLLPDSVVNRARTMLNRPNSVPSSDWLGKAWFMENGVSSLGSARVNSHPGLSEALLHGLQCSPLPSLLRFEDRSSMHFGIESRVPFLNTEIVEFLFSQPEQYLIGNDATTKCLFRAAMRGIVPDEILDRKDKIGFATPESSWLSELGDWTLAEINSDIARSIPAINQQVIKTEIERILAGKPGSSLPVWRCLNVIRWAACLDVKF